MAINFGFSYFDGIMSIAKKQIILSNGMNNRILMENQAENNQIALVFRWHFPLHFAQFMRQEWTESSAALLESKSLVAKMCVITIKLPNRLVYFNGCWFVQASNHISNIDFDANYSRKYERANKQTIEQKWLLLAQAHTMCRFVQKKRNENRRWFWQ